MRTEVKGRHADLDRLVAYAVGSLSRSERDRVAAHVWSCAECRGVVEEYLEVGLAIGASAPRRVPSTRLRVRVLGAVATERKATPRISLPRPRLAPARLRIATAAVLAVVLPLALVLGIGLVAPAPALATSTTLTIIGGAVEIARDGVWAVAEDGATVGVGDRVRTGADGHVVLTFFDGSTLTLGPRTDVGVEELVAGADGRVIAVFQSLGLTWSSVKRATSATSRYEVRTPSSTAAVRGTGFETEVLEDGSSAHTINDGLVGVTGRDEEVLVRPGERTTVRRDERPSPPAPAPARPRVTFAADAPMLVVGPAGLACGMTPQGDVVRQARCSVEGSSVVLTGLGAGAYQVVVRAAVDRAVTVRATAFLGDAVTFERAATVSLRAGEQAVAGIGVRTRADGAYEADEFAPFTTTERSPAKIVAKKREASGDAKRLVAPASERTQDQPGQERRDEERARTPEQDRTRDRDSDRRPEPLPAVGPQRDREPERTREPEPPKGPESRGREEPKVPEPPRTQIAVPRVELPRLPELRPSAPAQDTRREAPKAEPIRAPESEGARPPAPQRERAPRLDAPRAPQAPRAPEPARPEAPRAPEAPRLDAPRAPEPARPDAPRVPEAPRTDTPPAPEAPRLDVPRPPELPRPGL